MSADYPFDVGGVEVACTGKQYSPASLTSSIGCMVRGAAQTLRLSDLCDAQHGAVYLLEMAEGAIQFLQQQLEAQERKGGRAA